MQDLIEEYLELFHLNKKADQRELEIAYETLTKNATDSQIAEYKEAFEYLMCKFYCVTEIKDEEDIDKIYRDTYQNAPQVIHNCVEFFETLNDVNLSDKEKAIWSTLGINLPMLYCSIHAHVKNFFGFKFIPSSSIKDVIKTACLNPLKYDTITFSMVVDDIEDIALQTELWKFCCGLKKIFNKDIHSISVFDISETNYGVMGCIVAETHTAQHLLNLLKSKTIQNECKISISTTIPEFYTDDEDGEIE